MKRLIPDDPQLRAAHILVVDDLPANVELLANMLEMAGFETVTCTTDPYEGLAICEAAEPPDLVLLDYRMPGLDGPSFIRRVRERAGELAPPILMVTAQRDEESRRTALEAGAHDFVTKPFAFWELLARTRNLLQLQLLNKARRDQAVELQRLVGERTQELERTRSEIIRRLCNAGEFRDEATGQHVTRIGRLSGAMGELLGFSAADVEALRNAAPLHDIGKIGIPDRVLLKPGKLDAEEWVIMRTHCALGAQILAGSELPLLDLAAEIALTHHERWDGAGYPNNLTGNDIPLHGRIVAICDVFDALLSRRSYKSAWTVPDTLEHLRQGAGSHLDPDLVRLFLNNADSMVAIRNSLAD